MNEHSSNNGTSEEDGRPVIPENTQVESLNVRSAEVQEIIGRPPHWLVRGGITGFFGVFALILLSASVIKYPDVIDAPIKLTAINEPKLLTSKINGKLVKLNFDNNVRIKQGQILAWIESTAGHKDVLRLSALADSMSGWLQMDQLERFRSVKLSRFNDLGELQADFQAFAQAFREFITFLPRGFYSHRRQMLQQEMKYTEELLNNLKKQKEIQQINLKLAQQEYKAQKKLAAKDLIAPIDLSKAESKVAAARLPLQQTESAIINNRATRTAKEKELLELNKQISEQMSIFRQALNILNSAIEQWKKDYLITAPIDGKLVYAGIFQENQTLEAGQPVVYIQPENTRFFGEMAISQRSFGKIREGQRVLVRFSGYPDQEFGSVAGKIDYFSEFPVQDSVFLAKVNFPNGLTSNYGQEISPVNGMTGQAEIITQDMGLLERFYNNIAKQIR